MSSKKRLIAAVSAVTAALFTVTSCGLSSGTALSTVDETKTIRMIVTESSPYQDPTEIVQEQLAEQGWTLETTYVTDIVLPNNAVQNGEYDVNFFQHKAFLRQFNQDNGTSLEPAFSVYLSRSGLFSIHHDSLEELPEGAKIAIAVDTSNNGRALWGLHEAGLITVDETKEITEITQADILDNPKNFEFVEVDQQTLGHTLPDVDAGYTIVRRILDAGYDVADTALYTENDDRSADLFTIVIAAPEQFRDTEAARVLQEAYHSEEVRDWYSAYEGGMISPITDITLDNADEKWEEFTS